MGSSIVKVARDVDLYMEIDLREDDVVWVGNRTEVEDRLLRRGDALGFYSDSPDKTPRTTAGEVLKSLDKFGTSLKYGDPRDLGWDHPGAYLRLGLQALERFLPRDRFADYAFAVMDGDHDRAMAVTEPVEDQLGGGAGADTTKP